MKLSMIETKRRTSCSFIIFFSSSNLFIIISILGQIECERYYNQYEKTGSRSSYGGGSNIGWGHGWGSFWDNYWGGNYNSGNKDEGSVYDDSKSNASPEQFPSGCGKSSIISKRIVNGKETQEDEFPWMVEVEILTKNYDREYLSRSNFESLCGGSILNNRWIVTAAHCFLKDKSYEIDPNILPSDVTIRVGSRFRKSGQKYKISEIVVYPHFWQYGFMNGDIALLKTSQPIKLANKQNIKTINSICLPSTSGEEPKHSEMTVIGWGRTVFDGPTSQTLLEVSLPIISDVKCLGKFRSGYRSNPIFHSQICTWTAAKDACQGDSGGPAFEINNGIATLIGIVSYGQTCADEFPGVFTQVSYFIDWINENINN